MTNTQTPNTPNQSALSAAEAKFLRAVSIWDALLVYYTDLERADLTNALEAKGYVVVDRSNANGNYMVVSLSPVDDEADLRRAEHGTPAYEGWDASDEERIMQQIAIEATAEDETDGVLVGDEAVEMPCKTCGTLFWSLDSEHTECRRCDEMAGLTNRISSLETLVADLQKALQQMQRRADREADFVDWQSSRGRGDSGGF